MKREIPLGFTSIMLKESTENHRHSHPLDVSIPIQDEHEVIL